MEMKAAQVVRKIANEILKDSLTNQNADLL